MNGASGAIQSVRRAIEVLFCFDHDKQTLTAAEIAPRLGLNRTTTWRYLQSLAESGLVRELGDSGQYSLGPRTMRLAEIYASQWGDLTLLSSAVLANLRDATDETAALHVRQGWERVVVSQAESRQELRRTYRDIGESVSLIVGAPSVAILAWLTRRERDMYLSSQLADEPVRHLEIEQEIQRVRERGYAVSKRTRTKNIASVAAPVLAVDGSVVASINVSGPADRFTEDLVETVAEHVMVAASEIERRLATTHSHEVQPPDKNLSDRGLT